MTRFSASPILSIAVIVAGVAVLSSCTTLDTPGAEDGSGPVYFSSSNCTGQANGSVDWDSAQFINMTFDFESLSPVVVDMEARQPYILTVKNDSDDVRLFSASDFLTTASIESVGDSGTKGCFSAVSLGPDQTAEVRLIPTVRGRYEVNDRRLPIIFSTGPAAIINVR